jgi:hypothetical protein
MHHPFFLAEALTFASFGGDAPERDLLAGL